MFLSGDAWNPTGGYSKPPPAPQSVSQLRPRAHLPIDSAAERMYPKDKHRCVLSNFILYYSLYIRLFSILLNYSQFF